MTFTGPDLEPAREAVENLMDDTCVITRDEEGHTDDVLDRTTGVLDTGNDPAAVYDGKAKFRKVSDSTDDSGQISVVYYEVSIPLAGDPLDEVKEGDIVTCTSSRRDPALPGRRFRIRDIVYGTFAIQRKFTCEGRSRVADRP